MYKPDALPEYKEIFSKYGPCHVVQAPCNHEVFIIFETKACVESALEDLKGSALHWMRSIKCGKREWVSWRNSDIQGFQVLEDPVLNKKVQLQVSDGAVDDDRGHRETGRSAKKAKALLIEIAALS